MNIFKTIKNRTVVLTAALLFMSALSAGAQHYIGVRGGWGMGYGRFEPVSRYINGQVWGLWSGGVQWKYYGQVRYIGALGAEVEFIQRAYKYSRSLNSEDYTSRVVNSVNIPVIWHIHMNTANNRFRVFLNAGVWGSYNFRRSYETIMSNGFKTTRPYDFKLVKDNPLGFGLLGGVGFNVVFDRWEFMFEGRYYFSYGDILRNNAVYAGNPVRSPLDNVSFSLGFFYRLGKKAHTPLPPPWYQRMIDKKALKDAQEQTGKSGEADEQAGKNDKFEEGTQQNGAEESENIQQQINYDNDGNDQTEQGSPTNTERR